MAKSVNHLVKLEKTGPRGEPLYQAGGVELSEAQCKAAGIIQRENSPRERTLPEILNRRNSGRKMRGEGVPA